ncbi:hypothetical protein MRX96_032753 [Rhipicephalus microplus]
MRSRFCAVHRSACTPCFQVACGNVAALQKYGTALSSLNCAASHVASRIHTFAAHFLASSVRPEDGEAYGNVSFGSLSGGAACSCGDTACSRLPVVSGGGSHEPREKPPSRSLTFPRCPAQHYDRWFCCIWKGAGPVDSSLS